MEGLLDLLDLRVELRSELVREVAALPDLFEDRAVGAQVLDQFLREARHIGDRNVVEEAVHACIEHRNLFLGRNRLVLRLVEERDHPLTASKGVPGRFVEVGAELSERLQLAVLRQVEAQPARDLLHRLRLRRAPDA